MPAIHSDGYLSEIESGEAYTIMATRDTSVSEHIVYPMCGTTLRPD